MQLRAVFFLASILIFWQSAEAEVELGEGTSWRALRGSFVEHALGDNRTLADHGPDGNRTNKAVTETRVLLSTSGYWSDVASASKNFDFEATEKAFEKAFGKTTWAGIKSGAGIAVGAAASVAAAALNGDWQGAAKAGAEALVGLLGLVDPLFGIIGGLVMAFFPAPQETGPDFKKLIEVILNATEGMITENNVQNMEYEYSQAWTDVLLEMDTFHRDFIDKPASERLQEWRDLERLVRGSYSFIFGKACTNGKFDSLPGIHDAEDCKKLLAQGLFVKQLSFAGLHLHIFSELAKFDSYNYDAVTDMKAWAGHYAGMLKDSLWEWGEYGARDVACEYGDITEQPDSTTNAAWWGYKELKDDSDVFKMTGESISKTLGCTPWVELTSTCRREDQIDGAHVGWYPAVACAWHKENDLCKSDGVPSDKHGACKSMGGIFAGYYDGDCSYGGPRPPTHPYRCKEEDFDSFRKVWAKRVHAKYDAQVQQLSDLHKNIHECAPTGEDVNQLDYYHVKLPAQCCTATDVIKADEKGAHRCQKNA